MRASIVTSAFLVLVISGPVTAINAGWVDECVRKASANCKGSENVATQHQKEIFQQNYFGCLCKTWIRNYPEDGSCHGGCMKDRNNDKAFCDNACKLGGYVVSGVKGVICYEEDLDC
ncbi:unnamed protein product [Tilletia laevis]|uniref:Uncharacterized protein n=2 Tax=Tilletia TaxID=13289 RepID=A0A9N8MB69_9BASI|nr:hypothetical protein CF335_g9692 [Tilletia laevis]CAD6889280.1 unnamed protein product [Tilletia caries]CAD6972412.1 unnamed protein product [Tilletia controversa]CAD6921066.1 unnamed protein product [Tilletia caries]CAD6948969.1 unnamed protein product [Tilletia caries]